MILTSDVTHTNFCTCTTISRRKILPWSDVSRNLPFSVSIKRKIVNERRSCFIDKLVTWLPLGMLTLRVLRASPYLHLSSPASYSFRVLSSFYSPSILFAFTQLTSDAFRGNSGSFGDFGSIFFIVTDQVTSSIIYMNNISYPEIRKSNIWPFSDFSSISHLLPSLSLYFHIIIYHLFTGYISSSYFKLYYYIIISTNSSYHLYSWIISHYLLTNLLISFHSDIIS